MRKVQVIMMRQPYSKRKGLYIKSFDDIDKLAWFVTRPENKHRIYRFNFLSRKLRQQLMQKAFSLDANG